MRHTQLQTIRGLTGYESVRVKTHVVQLYRFMIAKCGPQGELELVPDHEYHPSSRLQPLFPSHRIHVGLQRMAYGLKRPGEMSK